MTDYRFHSVRRRANGQVAISIVVGKTDRIAEIPLTREQTIDMIIDLARAMKPEARQ